MSKPPEPSASARAWTFTRTSSPSATGPVSRGYATHGSPSTSIRAKPSCRSTTAVTRPRRRLSIQRARDVHEPERDIDHPLEVVDGDPLIRSVDVLHAVREVETAQAALVEDVRVRCASAEAVTRRKAAPLERGVRDSHDLVLGLEAVAAVALVHLRLDRAVLEARRECSRIEHLLHDVLQLLRVVRASLDEERAPLRDDVAGGAALDEPDVRGRLIID